MGFLGGPDIVKLVPGPGSFRYTNCGLINTKLAFPKTLFLDFALKMIMPAIIFHILGALVECS